MNEKQKNVLQIRGTDIDGVLERLGGNTALYDSCLRAFLADPTIKMLNEAIDNRSYDDAFTAAHALKGLAGNMGFFPLMHQTGQLVILIRSGRVNDISKCLSELNSSCRDIIDGINRYFAFADENIKE